MAAASFSAGLIVLMMWLVGAMGPKVEGGAGAGLASLRPIGVGRVVEVVRRAVPIEETAVGTFEPVHRVEVASRLLARAVAVDVTAGQRVAKGDVLVRLEDADLRARLAQSRSAGAQARAALDQAGIEKSRLRAAFESNAVASLELDRAVNALRACEANLARTGQEQIEAATVLEFATIRSPIDGVVVDKRINDGDTVSPGQVVVSVLDPSRLQLVADIRESLSGRVAVGGAVSVRIDGGDSYAGIVAEVVPEAEASSRTFQVKVRGPYPAAVRSGMFGRVSIANGEETVLLIPRAAVRTVGQVDCVDVAIDGSRRRRAVRLGRIMGGEVEVLAGLSAGERVVVDAGLTSTGGR